MSHAQSVIEITFNSILNSKTTNICILVLLTKMKIVTFYLVFVAITVVAVDVYFPDDGGYEAPSEQQDSCALIIEGIGRSSAGDRRNNLLFGAR